MIHFSQKYVILGGTHQRDDWDLDPRQKDVDNIIQGCSQLLPGLKVIEAYFLVQNSHKIDFSDLCNV